jgi:quinol monooxygenase YgiN
LIFITAKFQIKPEHADAWPEITRSFTEATNAEDGCLWFSWSRSVEDAEEYVLVEAFRDGPAAGEHVGSEHFKSACERLPQYLVATPKIVNFQLEQDDWSELGEMRVEGQS